MESDKVSSLVLPERMNAPAPRQLAEASPMGMLQLAVQRGDDIEKITKLMELAERMQANQARQDFNSAFAQFKAEAVRIVKRTETTSGPLEGKKYANLFDVVAAITEPLAKHGLSMAWKLTKDDPTWMEVTCTLRHSSGHSESVSMGAAPDTGPGRNAIQARGSAKSYLERYTATAITGLAASNTDDDGSGGKADTLTEEQAATIVALIEDVGADKAKFLKFLKVKTIEEIPAKAYAYAVESLNAKRAK
ncbi:MAG: ERF family protein [Gallionella sp.]|jgi:hypothetical protein